MAKMDSTYPSIPDSAVLRVAGPDSEDEMRFRFYRDGKLVDATWLTRPEALKMASDILAAFGEGVVARHEFEELMERVRNLEGY